MTENQNQAPALTLEPAMTRDKVMMEEAVKQLEAAPAAAVETATEMDTSMLSEADRRVIEEFAGKIDLNNTDHVLLYGSDAQKKIADFSDSALATVRTNDTGEVGEMLVKLVNEIKGFGDAAEKPKGIGGLFWNAKKAVSDMQTKYDKVEVNVDAIASSLEGYQVQLLKDISLFNHLYDMNTEYFKELTMYILAGKQKLQDVREGKLKELEATAQRTGLAEDAQAARDLAEKCNRFEKKIYDLELTRTISIQTAPQIRMIQNNDTVMVEKIQTTLVNTIPLWKNQMVLALGIAHSTEAATAQRQVNDVTNSLLKKNAEALHMASVETAKEAERGIVDIETLKKTNQDLIATLDDVMKVQAEGRQKRLAAEAEMAKMEADLKNKLLEIRSGK